MRHVFIYNFGMVIIKAWIYRQSRRPLNVEGNSEAGCGIIRVESGDGLGPAVGLRPSASMVV